MIIDLRSDTVTKPTAAMHSAMVKAPVGDDVFGEDPSINTLEEKAANLFGMENALFCPSGTMTNQIALKVHTRQGDEIICHDYAHIYNYEGGGMAFNSGCQAKLIGGDRGLMQAKDVHAAIGNPLDVHAARTSVVAVENTSNKGGGSCYELETLAQIKDVCSNNGLAYHLDGARLFNALEAKQQKASDYGHLFDSISICLSKGLGCPVGSLLLGANDFIFEAKRIRKKLGGGMRQAGFLAAAGIYALDHHISRLSEDHHKAQLLKQGLENCAWIERIEPVETNIVIFYLKAGKSDSEFLQELSKAGILAIGMGQGKLRFVTHLDVTETQINSVCDKLQTL